MQTSSSLTRIVIPRPAVALIAIALAACAAAPNARAADAHDHGPAKVEKAAGGDGHDHGGHADEVKLTPDAIRASGVRVDVAKARTLTATISAPARLAYDAEAMAHVGAIVPGRIRELKVRLGDAVKVGDALAIVDSPELGQAQGDFLQRRTAVETAGPAVELAQAAFERAQKLFDSTQGITLTEVQARQREFQAARADVRNAEASLAAAKSRLALLGMNDAAIATLGETGQIDPTYTIRAPIDGRVIERAVTLGELVGPDKEDVLRLANLDAVWALADVPETKLAEAHVGAAATVTLPGLGGASVDGTVAFIAHELDAATRTARVRIVLPNADGRLRPGMFGRADIAGAAAGGEPVVAVPEAAVLVVEGEPSVFVPVEGEPNTFARRAVGVGGPVGGMLPVFAGLAAGEPYVASGTFILKAELGKAGAAHAH